jgi:CubicO group peptidase (beta-lactamase class C family)
MGAVLDDTLRNGITLRKIPAVVAMVADHDRVLYKGAFGHRETDGPPVQLDSIFRVASMTKAVTTVAALQLMERGKVSLDEPVARHLPQFKNVQLLAGFDAQGEPILRPAVTPPTLRHLLTHTSGLCYDMWDPDMFRYASKCPTPDNVPGPLIFEPGTRWQYGQGLDWTGRLVETISGLTLEDYFQQNICTPLGMADTSFIFPAEKFERLVTNYRRNESGDLQRDDRKFPTPPKTFGGGGGLYSTAADYIRFMQMILNHGLGPNGGRVLRADTVAEMEVNQIGALTAGKMKTQRPDLTSDVDLQPGQTEKWSLGFLINTTAYPGGRSAGSLAWAGLLNTYYWIDPKRDLCAVILMQYLPFADQRALGLLGEFEQAVYATKPS